jgi:hypothetical protein
MGVPPARLALTLTFATQVDYKQAWSALRYFWQMLRKSYPKTEYWGVVEYNQQHTQPHLHFVLGGVTFIPYQFIRAAWSKAQTWAKITDIAFISRIEEIRGNIQQYFTKYITKLIGGKDEIPRREQWQGRYVRYSRKFFPTNVPTMAVYASWKRQFDLDLFQWKAKSYTIHNDRASAAGLTHFINLAKIADQELLETLNRPWLDQDDKLLGVKVTLDIFDIADYNNHKMPLHERHLIPLTYPL